MNEKFPHRVLIIEDDPDSAESLKLLLEINDFKVEAAHEGENGLTKAAWFDPQVIICDISLRGKLNGLQVAEALRKDKKLESIYLIALSGYGRAEDVEQAKCAGFNDYMVKPVDFDKLIKLIENRKTVN